MACWKPNEVSVGRRRKQATASNATNWSRKRELIIYFFGYLEKNCFKKFKFDSTGSRESWRRRIRNGK